MRKGWVVAAFLFVVAFPLFLCVQEGTAAPSQLELLAQRFSDTEKDLRETRVELWELGKALGDNNISLVVYKLEVAEVICHFEGHLISLYPDTKDSARQDYVNKTVAELSAAKKKMGETLKGIQEIRTYIPYPPALQMMDKAKASIESSVGFMDDAIAAFHALTK